MSRTIKYKINLDKIDLQSHVRNATSRTVGFRHAIVLCR